MCGLRGQLLIMGVGRGRMVVAVCVVVESQCHLNKELKNVHCSALVVHVVMFTASAPTEAGTRLRCHGAGIHCTIELATLITLQKSLTKNMMPLLWLSSF
jgi:hypothetical protein